VKKVLISKKSIFSSLAISFVISMAIAGSSFATDREPFTPSDSSQGIGGIESQVEDLTVLSEPDNKTAAPVESEPDTAGQAGCDCSSVSEAAPPEIDGPISEAELRDLQFVAGQEGISLQEDIDRYAWNDNFALAVTMIREASPEAFADAAIVDANHAWVAFTGSAPKEALDIIYIFTGSHSSVSVEVRTGSCFTEAELQSAIEAVHYAVLESPDVLDASTWFDTETGRITTTVVLESTASASVLDDLGAVAGKALTEATRADILNCITTSVVRSNIQVTGGSDSSTEHLDCLTTKDHYTVKEFK